jgi:hypothetical protein
MLVLLRSEAQMNRLGLLLASPTFQQGGELFDGAGIRDREGFLHLPGFAVFGDDPNSVI